MVILWCYENFMYKKLIRNSDNIVSILLVLNKNATALVLKVDFVLKASRTKN